MADDSSQGFDLGDLLKQLYGTPLPAPQLPPQDTTPVQRSWASLLGELLGGGGEDILSGLSPAQREAAGSRAMFDAGLRKLNSPTFATVGQALAGGFGGAEESLYNAQAAD